MYRSLPFDRTRAPKLLHQSWKNDTLPAKFQRWSATCQKANPDWEYVLWSDKDNLELITRFAPWFLKTYKDLKSEIYRADAIRNVYMHVFGGVYADLDTECIKSYDSLFAKYNISTAPYPKLNITLPPVSLKNDTIPPPPTRKAFLGRMGTDDNSEHSIPNAWMASTPGHPFWLLPLEKIRDNINNGGFPEVLTGPISLRAQISDYQVRYHGQQTSSHNLDEYYARGPWAALYPPRDLEELEILPFWMIYPYSWQRDGDAYRAHCLVGQELFNSTRCKEVLSVRAWGSWSITYWSHSWDASGSQHLEGLKEEKEKGKKKGKEGDDMKQEQDDINDGEEEEEGLEEEEEKMDAREKDDEKLNEIKEKNEHKQENDTNDENTHSDKQDKDKKKETTNQNEKPNEEAIPPTDNKPQNPVSNPSSSSPNLNINPNSPPTDNSQPIIKSKEQWQAEAKEDFAFRMRVKEKQAELQKQQEEREKIEKEGEWREEFGEVFGDEEKEENEKSEGEGGDEEGEGQGLGQKKVEVVKGVDRYDNGNGNGIGNEGKDGDGDGDGDKSNDGKPTGGEVLSEAT
ncbi:MAG: hypothetical protein Q9164_006217 [Protoblastenia rupestris]